MRREAADDANLLHESQDVSSELKQLNDEASSSATTEAKLTGAGRRKSSRRIHLKSSSVTTSSTSANGEGAAVTDANCDDADKSDAVNGKGSKSRRNWEMWTPDNTQWFFEALAEHGKDFAAIQLYMSQRSEKIKGIKNNSSSQDLVKNRDQVRHYYYRTWHKIANCLNISNSIDKQTQELYGLINYGEIWKKLERSGTKFDSKLKKHLEELVLDGHTIVKIKGKNVKLKTPICKALKKLNKIDDAVSGQVTDASNLPKEVLIELHPSSNDDWIKVHSACQNPRLRSSLPLQKRLSVLIKYLETRWSSTRTRLVEAEQLANCTQPTSEINVKESRGQFRIRVGQQLRSNITQLSISRPTIAVNNQGVSLNAYLKRFGEELDRNSKRKAKSSLKNASKSTESLDVDETARDYHDKDADDDKDEDDNVDEQLANCDQSANRAEVNPVVEFNHNSNSSSQAPIKETVKKLSALKDMLESAEQFANPVVEETISKSSSSNATNCQESTTVNLITNVLPPANATLSQWLSGTCDNHNPTESVNPVPEDPEEEAKPSSDSSPEKELNQQQLSPGNDLKKSPTESTNCSIRQLNLEQLERGWSVAEAQLLTIGELYLMLNCPPKIIFEYFWAKDESSSPASRDLSNIEPGSELVLNPVPLEGGCLSKLLITAHLALANLSKSRSQTGLSAKMSPTKLNYRKQKKFKTNSEELTGFSEQLTNSDTSTTQKLNPVPACQINLNSGLLSSVISNTILTDSSDSKQEQLSQQLASQQLNQQLGQSTTGLNSSNHSFVIPSSPAPKSSKISSNVILANSTRTVTTNGSNRKRIICDDPKVLQLAIQQLNVKRTKRAKPVLKTISPKPLLPRLSSGYAAPVFGQPVNPIHLTGFVNPVTNQRQLAPAISCLQLVNPVQQLVNSIPMSVTTTTSQLVVTANPIVTQTGLANPAQQLQNVNSVPITSMMDVPIFEENARMTTISKSGSEDGRVNKDVDPMACGDGPQINGLNCSRISNTISATMNAISDVNNQVERPFSSLTNCGLTNSQRSDPLVSAMTEGSGLLDSPMKSLVSGGVNSGLEVLPSQWLNGESSNLSLGSLFNPVANESPIKSDHSSSKGLLNLSGLSNSASLPAVDVESSVMISTLVNENTADLVAKFKDLVDNVDNSNLGISSDSGTN